MKTLTIPTALALTLLATTAFANQDTLAPETNSTGSQSQQDINNEAGAHGYQNPAGQDPEPRLSEDTIDNAHGTDAGDEDKEDSPQRAPTEQ
ncbi:hypothetical protein [Pseudomonas sp. DNDY-54]|uniref:hypothetical protein n=1 Tax=Pseudomonas sp. DNDY-54 TaxID=2870860 RepID=UPI001CA4214E|nr:hypothetical protein [Pseudomonas sp. DNDY-54]